MLAGGWVLLFDNSRFDPRAYFNKSGTTFFFSLIGRWNRLGPPTEVAWRKSVALPSSRPCFDPKRFAKKFGGKY